MTCIETSERKTLASIFDTKDLQIGIESSEKKSWQKSWQTRFERLRATIATEI
jgi:hypothetical protein